MKTKKYFISIVLLLSSCALERVTSDHDPKIDFSTIRSYNFYMDGLAKLQVNSLDKDRLTEIITTSLKEKGLERSPKPDVLVNIVLIENGSNASTLAGGYVFDYSDAQFHWTNSIYSPYANLHQGRILAIDLIDPITKNLVWHGQTTGFKDGDFDGRNERIKYLVGRILERYSPAELTKY